MNGAGNAKKLGYEEIKTKEMELSHTLKLTGLSELPEPLEINKDYLISVNATITDINKKSDDHGGYIFTYKAKQRTCEVLKANGEILVAKVKGSQSQKLRTAIMGAGADYDQTMGAIRAYLPEVLGLIKKLDENIH